MSDSGIKTIEVSPKGSPVNHRSTHSTMAFKQILAFTGILALAELAASQGQRQAHVPAYGQCGKLCFCSKEIK